MKKILKLFNFYQIMAVLCMISYGLPFNYEERGWYLITCALFYIAYELSDKKPVIIEIERKAKE